MSALHALAGTALVANGMSGLRGGYQLPPALATMLMGAVLAATLVGCAPAGSRGTMPPGFAAPMGQGPRLPVPPALVTLRVGEAVTLPTPAGTRWVSSNQDVLVVQAETGLVTGVGPGRAQATTADGVSVRVEVLP